MEFKEQGRSYEVSGNYNEAIKNYLQAIVEYEKNPDKEEDSKGEIGYSLFRAAACFVEIQEYNKAIKLYQNAITAYSQSLLEPGDKFHNISNCCADLATCLLYSKEGNPDYSNAIRFFEKAKEFIIKRAELEENVLQKYIYERAAIYSIFIALIHLLQNLPENAKEILGKTDELMKRYKVGGFGQNLFMFAHNLLNSQFQGSRQNLQIIETESENLSLSGPSFQAILLGLLQNALIKYVPEERIHLTKVIIEEKGYVILNLSTFKNILLHTLFYANFNINRSNWKETYGLLIGTIKNDDVIIADAVPITSGEKYEVAFEEKHYSKAAEFDALAVEKGFFTIGWYHSHPGLGLFLSPTDILNQLGYQNLNPKAIAFVFDFTEVTEENLGFEVFRLDDTTLGTNSDFHKVQYKIPDIKKNFQKEIPTIIEKFIKELREKIVTSPKISIKEISETLNYSSYIIKEILIELYKNKEEFAEILFDIEADTILNENFAFRAILDFIKDDKIVKFSLISKRLEITENFTIKILENMLNKGLIQGKIRLSSSDFIKS